MAEIEKDRILNYLDTTMNRIGNRIGNLLSHRNPHYLEYTNSPAPIPIKHTSDRLADVSPHVSKNTRQNSETTATTQTLPNI